MIFVKGIVGIFFRQLGMCIAAMLLASLAASLTLTPVISSLLLGPRGTRKPGLLSRIGQPLFVRMVEAYAAVLGIALKHRAAVAVGALGLSLLSLALIPRIGTEFTSEGDTGEVRLTLELPVGTRAERTNEFVERVAGLIASRYGQAVQHIFTCAGYDRKSLSAAFGERESSNIGMIYVRFVRMAQSSFTTMQAAQEIAQMIESALDLMPYLIRRNVTAADPMAGALFGSSNKPLTVEVLGQDFADMEQVAGEIQAVMAWTAGVHEPMTSRDIARPELSIVVDREAAAKHKTRVGTVVDYVPTYVYGRTVTKFRERGDEYDLFVRLGESDRSLVEDLGNLTVPNADGKPIRVDAIARVRNDLGPVEIERKEQQRLISVGARIYGRPLGDVARDVRRGVEKPQIPHGTMIRWGGYVEEQAIAFKWLFIALALGILLVYMVMACQFESLLDPLVIMFSVPFAITGVLVALYLTRIPLGVIPFVGVIMLVGIVVNNAIVLVDYTNICGRGGMELFEAVKLA